MASVFTIDELLKESERRNLSRSFQSGHINFIFGSGASMPAVPIASAVEQEIAALFEAANDEAAWNKLYEFLQGLDAPNNKLIENAADANNTNVLQQYRDFLRTVETILSERRTSLLPKQATIFTTNYDLFFEKAATTQPNVRLNDGFGRVPSLDGRMEYSSRNFFDSTYNTGNLYSYRVEIPCINLLKLHGSLSWKKSANEILFEVKSRLGLPADRTAAETKAFVEGYAVVLPQATKFRTTTMDRTYYDLLRIYANQLDRENALLIGFGFSFADDHIFDITRKALQNPTLRVVVFAYDTAACASFATKFVAYNNVAIVTPPAGEQIDFSKFNHAMRGLLPKVELPA